ncbi:hypothetical protein GPA19_11560 [Azoarcus indigens]|uniref:Uncharacterized protein n=1 Tax=Azoarcus indigens TaxID=29545 RepID=A0A4R6DZU7_9RHOO|nr:hypothetical protein [Azoarcus indigens]NMG65585.1 hypothetical protein [Azoarcus indigens]TDN50008.1 hypothetical protein C7389_110102 [Azoarcus indigens]
MEPSDGLSAFNGQGIANRAAAYCLSGGKKLPFARFLYIEADRLQLLFEEPSILELR